MKNIWIYAGGYPTPDCPEMAFLRPVAEELTRSGLRCTVVAPQSVVKAAVNHQSLRPTRWVDCFADGSEMPVVQPRVLSFARKKVMGVGLSSRLRAEALKRELARSPEKPDIIYAHFWHSAIEASMAAEGKIPVVAVTGESVIWAEDECGSAMVKAHLSGIKGVISVSSQNLKESAEKGLLACHPKTVVLPNGYNGNEFYPMDKNAAREAMGLHKNDCIAVFVGAFSERKGVLRVVEAAEAIPGLKLILIGAGEQKPVSEKIVFQGRLPHDKVVQAMNAADFFVLPTLAEGCCNAIVEALACGLPVISADRDFNDDILSEDNSIRVDPTSVAEIRDAMERLCQDDALRGTLSRKALESAQNLRVERRAEKIAAFLADCVGVN